MVKFVIFAEAFWQLTAWQQRLHSLAIDWIFWPPNWILVSWLMLLLLHALNSAVPLTMFKHFRIWLLQSGYYIFPRCGRDRSGGWARWWQHGSPRCASPPSPRRSPSSVASNFSGWKSRLCLLILTSPCYRGVERIAELQDASIFVRKEKLWKCLATATNMRNWIQIWCWPPFIHYIRSVLMWFQLPPNCLS